MSDDAELAALLAAEAGELLVAAREGLLAEHGPSAPAAKDAADLLAQNHLAARLAAERPGDLVLSEEARDDLARLDADRVWIIDPLDGTREYVRPGRIDWAVHVALWARGRGLIAGAVALPAQNRVLATHDVTPPPLRAEEALRVVVSGSRTPQRLLDQLAQALPLDVTTWGSAGAKAALVITGEADLYLHDGALNEWDSAAPVVVAQAAGLVAVDLDGHALVFNRPVPVTGGLVIGRDADVDRVLSALRPA
jgi:3'(2'), 5'-bisphosphate nucleotidase